MSLIADVELETGLPRATLRIWERRYGFPAPGRDDRGDRVYPPEQVCRLQQMRVLIDQGHRPGRLMALGPQALGNLCSVASGLKAPAPAAPGTQLLLRTLREQDFAGVERLLRVRLTRVGLGAFIDEVASMNAAVGHAWQRGELEIHQEHFYTDCLQTVLRQAISQVKVPHRPEAPRVLLATLPQELHGLGLLMAQAMFAREGCPVLHLGVRLPAQEIAAAAEAAKTDLVGLTFAAYHSRLQLARDLGELRALLPPTVRIWVGGASAAAARLRLPGVRAVAAIREVPDLLAEDFALPPLAGRC